MKSTIVLIAFLGTGCASVIGADFDNAVPKPTTCDVLAPQSGDERTTLSCNSTSTCLLDDSGKASCVTVNAWGNLGDACTYGNDCAPGLTCTSLGCVSACEIGGSCPDGNACLALSNGKPAANGKTYGFCAPPSCDPISPKFPRDGLKTCASGSCRLLTGGGSACFQGTPPSRATSCDDDLNCPSAQSCIAGVCKPICLVANGCPGGKRCVADDYDVAGEPYGHCE